MLSLSTRHRRRVGLALALAAGAAAALASLAAELPVPPAARPPRDGARGELLYDLHCRECHTSQMHWRERRQARDWATLKAQVHRWQAAARLDWSDAEVEDVTFHLNETVYHFAPPTAFSVGR